MVPREADAKFVSPSSSAKWSRQPSRPGVSGPPIPARAATGGPNTRQDVSGLNNSPPMTMSVRPCIFSQGQTARAGGKTIPGRRRQPRRGAVTWRQVTAVRHTGASHWGASSPNRRTTGGRTCSGNWRRENHDQYCRGEAPADYCTVSDLVLQKPVALPYNPMRNASRRSWRRRSRARLRDRRGLGSPTTLCLASEQAAADFGTETQPESVSTPGMNFVPGRGSNNLNGPSPAERTMP
jgi:hypothetical protein